MRRDGEGPGLASPGAHLSRARPRLRPAAWRSGRVPPGPSWLPVCEAGVLVPVAVRQTPRLVWSASQHSFVVTLSPDSAAAWARPGRSHQHRSGGGWPDGGWTEVTDGFHVRMSSGGWWLASQDGPVADTCHVSSPPALGSLAAWRPGSKSECLGAGGSCSASVTGTQKSHGPASAVPHGQRGPRAPQVQGRRHRPQLLAGRGEALRSETPWSCWGNTTRAGVWVTRPQMEPHGSVAGTGGHLGLSPGDPEADSDSLTSQPWTRRPLPVRSVAQCRVVQGVGVKVGALSTYSKHFSRFPSPARVAAHC